MIKFKDVFENLKKDKKKLILMGCSVLALVLLIISELASSNVGETKANVETGVSSAEYIEIQEEKLKCILETIDGAGKVEVMITLESCYENVYLKDSSLKTQSTEEDFKKEEAETYVMAKKDSNTQEGIIIKVYEPVVKGVAVVAEGGGNENIKLAIMETVSAVFNINSTNISVEKMNPERME